MIHESDIRNRVLQLLAERPDLTAQKLCGYTTLAQATCKHFMSGQKPPSANLTAEFERVIDQVRRGEILQQSSEVVHLTESTRPKRPVKEGRNFYVTETVRAVAQVLNFCAAKAKIGVVTAEYGAGKTESLRHWRDHEGLNVEHLVFEFDEFTARNVCDFIWVLGRQLGCCMANGMMSGGKNFRLVTEFLYKQPCLLIFDQCESVQPRIAQVIRQLWDHTRAAGLGIVMLAAPVFIARLKASQTRDLGALTSRVGIWAPLRGVSKDEAAHILQQEGVKNIDESAFLLLWKGTNGSMRRLMAVVDLLVERHAGKPITERTIEGVASNLWGMELIGRSV